MHVHTHKHTHTQAYTYTYKDVNRGSLGHAETYHTLGFFLTVLVVRFTPLRKESPEESHLALCFPDT